MGVIQQSQAWKSAVETLEAGQEVQVKLTPDFLRESGITSPLNSFKVSLQRYVDRKLNGQFRIYVRNGIIFGVRKENT